MSRLVVVPTPPVMPSMSDTHLAGGLRLVVVCMPTVPVVELRLTIPFGATDTDMLASGVVLAACAVSDSDSILVDRLADAGAELAASVTPARLTYTGRCLRTGLGTVLEILASVLNRRSYCPQEVLSTRTTLSGRLALAGASPGIAARAAMMKALYDDHPLATVIPDAAAVARVDAEAVTKLHQNLVTSDQSCLVLVGDVDPDTAVATVSAALEQWQPSGNARPHPVLPPPDRAGLVPVPRDGANQSQIRLARAVPGRTDARYPVLEVANTAFGGYLSARWSTLIREDKGYCYTAQTGFQLDAVGGVLTVETDTASEATRQALELTARELDRFAAGGPTPEEVTDACRYLVGAHAILLHSQSHCASTMATLLGVGLPPAWLWDHLQRLNQLDVADVQAEAARSFAAAGFSGIVQAHPEILSSLATWPSRA